MAPLSPIGALLREMSVAGPLKGHHILETPEKELEKQGKFASGNRSDRGNGVPLAGGHSR